MRVPHLRPPTTAPRSYALFVLFYGFGTYIMLDMFIGIILDNFSYWYNEDESSVRLTRDDFRKYVHAQTSQSRTDRREGLGPRAG